MLALGPRQHGAVIRYQEHAQCVKRQRKRVEASSVQPDFGVLHRSRDVLPRDALISHSITVCTKTSSNELFLFRSDECSLRWPIHHIPVGGHSEEDSQYSLDDKDPSAFWSVMHSSCSQRLHVPPTTQTCDASHVTNAPRQDTSEGSSHGGG